MDWWSVYNKDLFKKVYVNRLHTFIPNSKHI